MPYPTTLASSVTRVSTSFGVTSTWASSPLRRAAELPGQGGAVHHRGYPQGDDRHPQGIPVQSGAGVAHAGARGDAGVGDLDCGAQPAHAPGGQGIHRQDKTGPDPVADRPHQLAALHPGGAQHPGSQGGHREEGAELLRVPGGSGAG